MMNDNIAKLLEKAKIRVWHNDGGLLSDKAFEVVAEMIALECASIAKHEVNMFASCQHAENVAEKILEKFGLE